MSKIYVEQGESLADALDRSKSGDIIILLGAAGSDTQTKEGVTIKRAFSRGEDSPWPNKMETK